MKTERQYYYKSHGCTAKSPDDPDCTCWHDEGDRPLDFEPSSWRDKPEDLDAIRRDAARWRELNRHGIARRTAESKGIVRVPVTRAADIQFDADDMPVPSIMFVDYQKYRLDIAWIDPECNTLESFVDKQIKEKKA